MDDKFIVNMLKEFGTMSQEEEKLAVQIVDIVPEYLTPNIEVLNNVLLNNTQDKILAIHLPGIKLSFKFKDSSVLECVFRVDLNNKLTDVKTTAITGTAAQLLAFVMQKRLGTLFSELIPLTEGEMKLYNANGNGQVPETLQRSFSLAQRLKNRLTMDM